MFFKIYFSVLGAQLVLWATRSSSRSTCAEHSSFCVLGFASFCTWGVCVVLRARSSPLFVSTEPTSFWCARSHPYFRAQRSSWFVRRILPRFSNDNVVSSLDHLGGTTKIFILFTYIMTCRVPFEYPTFEKVSWALELSRICVYLLVKKSKLNNWIILWLIFQIMSNGEYKAALHRVLANPSREPRVQALERTHMAHCRSWSRRWNRLFTVSLLLQSSCKGKIKELMTNLC